MDFLHAKCVVRLVYDHVMHTGRFFLHSVECRASSKSLLRGNGLECCGCGASLRCDDSNTCYIPKFVRRKTQMSTTELFTVGII